MLKTRKDLVDWYNSTHAHHNRELLWWFVQFVISCKCTPAKVINLLASEEEPWYEPDRQLLEQWAVAMYDYNRSVVPSAPHTMRDPSDLTDEQLKREIAPFVSVARSMVAQGLIGRA